MIPSFDIPPIEEPKDCLETALARGAKRSRAVKKPQERRLKALVGETERIKEVRSSLVASLQRLHDSFPSFDRLSEFTRRVFALDLDPGRVKQALGALGGSIRTIETLTRDHLARIRRARTEAEIVTVRTAYLGRVASVVRKLADPLALLSQARGVFRSLPTIDDEQFTVAITGFPNVGKSTLLARLTPAKPEIKPYAFTTTGLNVGSFDYRCNRIQVVDTPGTLDRANQNQVERKASVALRYLARCVVAVIDPTEASYPLAQQRALLAKVKELDKPVIVYLSKTDVADESVVRNLMLEFPDACTSADGVKKRILRFWKEEFA